ncbi:MAG: hypothetical protein IPM82_08105 [Saprospiraceae bacterium]|nr:hypothetical protein [Saprospiraceae bacterium]
MALSVENQAVARCPVTVTFEKATLDAALETLSTLFGAKVIKTPDGGFRLTGGRCG